MTKSSILRRPGGGGEQGDAAAAEALEQRGFGVVAGRMAAEAVIEPPRDQQALRRIRGGAKQRGAQRPQRGGKAGLGELVGAETEDRRLRGVAALSR